MNKSSLLLSFKKEESFFFKPLRGAFFFEKKKQKTFICLFGLVLGQAHAGEALSASDVQGIVTRVVEAAVAMKKPATVAVTDRMGSVLAVWQMPGAPDPVAIMNNPDGHNAGLNGAAVPATAVAISKALTASYLSSSYGNAFTTRTASQIIQDHFDPGTANVPSGPLYGVQFSQLPCADLMTRFVPGDALSITQGPHRSPLGLAGDPGGIPLYKGGQLVGGVGVKASGPYGLDLNIHVNDHSIDEGLALAGAEGFSPPAGIVASKITVGGLLLKYTDASAAALKATTLPGGLRTVPGYYAATNGFIAGGAYETAASGLVPDTSGLIDAADPPDVLITGSCPGGVCENRYPAIAGEGPEALSQAEVLTILRAGYSLILNTRAQIRNPPGSAAAISISVVDAYGRILGIISKSDAPIFGIDVSLQKARSAVLLSTASAGATLDAAAASAKYVTAATNFFHAPVFSQDHAWSARSIGNVARDTYPDGISGKPNGPLGISATYSTPFDDGLQLDLVTADLVAGLAYIEGASSSDAPHYCTSLPAPSGSTVAPQPVLADGLQIFPGGFPIFRNGVLVGGIGASGDGVDQDDLIAFLGLYNAGVALKTGVGHAPASIRANLLSSGGVAPVYVNCPFAPFLNNNENNVCSGK
jgi:uncharacterized protein GlcG (DUF336 family)